MMTKWSPSKHINYRMQWSNEFKAYSLLTFYSLRPYLNGVLAMDVHIKQKQEAMADYSKKSYQQLTKHPNRSL